MNSKRSKFLFGERIRSNFKELLSRDFWKKAGREISDFFGKFPKTIRVLRPNERRVIIILSIAIIVSAIILFRNYYLTRTTLNPQKGGVYIEGVAGSPKYLNPLLARSEVDRGIARILFLSLVNFDANGQPAPNLANAFNVQDSGRRYDFVLDDKISWQDGAKITADDVDFTLNILQSDGYSGPFSRSFDGVEIEKKSETEFSLILPETNSSFISILSELGILPKHIWKDVKPELLDKSELNLNPTGNGRYSFDPKTNKKNSNDEIVLKRAAAYKKDDKGYFDQIIFRSYNSPSDLVEAYRKGEINGFGGFTPNDISSIDRNTFRYYRLLIPRFTAVFLNLEKENLKELKLRQALASSVDKEQIIKEAYGGDAEMLKSPIPSFVAGFNSEIKDYPFNLDTAGAILSELKYIDSDNDGIREKDGKKLELNLYTTDDPALQKTSDLISTNWNKIGIKTKVIVIDLLTLQKTIIPSRQYDVVVLGENLDYPPDPYPYFHSSQIDDGLNISAYKNLAVDTLLEDARLSIDPNVKAEKLKSFSSIIAEDLPAISIACAPYLYGTNISIKGIPKKRVAQNSSDRFLEIGSWYIKTERKNK